MATFGQIIYMVLDLLKEHSDDAYYTEEHILFLASRMRALLLERKYRRSRNSGFSQMSDANSQTICLDLQPTELLPVGCSGNWLKSLQTIPALLDSSEPKAYPVSSLLGTVVELIPSERMPFVGHNKWLRHFIYAAKGEDDYLYLTSSNPQFLSLEKVKVEGVFSSPEKAAELACDSTGAACGDILEQDFPLEESLIPQCIEMVVQELLGSRYAPEDKKNNAKDDLGEAGVTSNRAARPARERRQEQEEAE